jgi:hypothetical protein
VSAVSEAAISASGNRTARPASQRVLWQYDTGIRRPDRFASGDRRNAALDLALTGFADRPGTLMDRWLGAGLGTTPPRCVRFPARVAGSLAALSPVHKVADRHGLIENSVTRDTSASEALDHLYQCAVPASTAVVDPAWLSLATGTLCEQLEQNAQMQRYLQLPLGVALQSSLRELFLVMDTDLPPWCKRYTAALQKAERSLPTAPRHRYRANEPKLLNPRLDMDRAGRSSSQQTDEDKKLRQQFRRELRATGRVLRRRQEVFAAQRLQAEHSRRVQLQRRARQATGLIGSEQLR